MRIAVIGFGFSGLMATANLIRLGDASLTLYIIAPEHTGLGVAYSTRHNHHLLNVRAQNMGAWADDAGHFAAWLRSDAGKYAAAARKLVPLSETDFAPRALYGDYLTSIWQAAQEEASAKRITLKLVPSSATRIAAAEPLAVMTGRGDAIAADKVILATGNAVKPILTQLHADTVLQDPWQLTEQLAAKLLGPIALVGTGLTAVDTILSLRAFGYTGDILALSRNGLFPQPHQDGLGSYAWSADALVSQRHVSGLLQVLRRHVVQHNGDWREVVDGLRPHTQTLWQKLKPEAQKRFLTRLFTLWNVHRHRMAQNIATAIGQEKANGTLKVLSLRQLTATMDGNQPVLTVRLRSGKEEVLKPSLIINCTGIELNLIKSPQPLLPQLLRDGLAEAHATGAGFAADKNYALWGAAYPNLYAAGTPMTGQFLESTAVPELRVQAQAVARHILTA